MESQKFKHIEDNLTNILLTMINNQNLKRYIKYLNDNPLEKSLSQPDITDNLIGTNILLTPLNTEVVTVENVYIFINPFSGDLTRYPVSDDIYSIDIMIPNDKWLISGKIRPIRIAHEISKNIDGLNIAGIGKVEITHYKTSVINRIFSCFSIFINVGSTSIKS